jgi:arylsulfatase A
LKGERQEKHDYLYWEFMEKGGRQAIRKGNWKAVKYGMTGNTDVPIQLFNLERDLGENMDIAAEHPEIIAEMDSLIQTSRTPSIDFQFDFEKRINPKE